MAVNSRPPHTSTHTPGCLRWSVPPTGRLKMNIDGLWSSNRKFGGVGFIVRNAVGDFVVAAYGSFRGVLVVARGFQLLLHRVIWFMLLLH